MTRFLLDTNMASFTIKATHPALDRNITRVPKHEIAISVITEAELRFGLALLPPEAKIHHVAERFLQEIETVSWDSSCAASYATLAAAQQRRGTPLSPLDTLIAAHAIALGTTLVTNDQAFRRVKGLSVEDWTKGPSRL